MSRPISQCWINKAALGDEEAYKTLLEATDYNLTCNLGIFTVFPCKCEPACAKPSAEQIKATMDKIYAVIEAREAAYQKLHPVGSFEKFVFPVIKSMPSVSLTELFKK